ncbi:hypothetical protein DPMN_060121 [Dreissena polymorpha]|uniref:Uncharacterized protein n=1 Tax=Dreissena polymorpha TaxID=45954 RepID=A0A9D4C554_DREPO|nr:hypothetical protein DPMN_060121 [Dreissena polymorpha]
MRDSGVLDLAVDIGIGSRHIIIIGSQHWQSALAVSIGSQHWQSALAVSIGSLRYRPDHFAHEHMDKVIVYAVNKIKTKSNSGAAKADALSPRRIDVILKSNFWWARPMLVDRVVIRDFQGSSANSVGGDMFTNQMWTDGRRSKTNPKTSLSNQAKNVTSIVFDHKENCPTPWRPDIYKTNLFTKFHDDWANNVTSRVFTSFFYFIKYKKTVPPAAMLFN